MNSDLLLDFNRIAENVSSFGFVKSLREGNTGVGCTYESYLGIKENNSISADYRGQIEVKTKRAKSRSMITLFTQSPKSSKAVISTLYESYGQLSSRGVKSLYSTCSGHRFNNYKRLYNFKLEVDRDLKVVWILAKECWQNIAETKKVGCYSFEELRRACRKINCLALVNSEVQVRGGIEHFKYSAPTIYHLKGFDSFLTCIEEGYVVLDLRIGTHKSGKNQGQPHDHGAAFRIKSSKINRLFSIL